METKKNPLFLRYGWRNFRPGYLQFMNNSKCFLLFATAFSISQGMTVGGISSAVLTTIEKRFQFTSRETGFIAASNDISAILLTFIASYCGGYGNKSKWLGYGALITGVGCFIHALPHFIIGRYQPEADHGASTGQRQLFCHVNTTNTTSDLEGSQCLSKYAKNWYYLMIFSVAQMVMGAGTSPLYSLAPAYIDENVHPKSCPVYFGVFFAAAIVGPGLGFLVAGAMLTTYVDLEMPKGFHITPRDSRWIGAWWLGYVMVGSLLVLTSVALSGFPRQLPGAKERREQLLKERAIPLKDQNVMENLKSIIPATKQLLKNPVFVFNALALSATTFGSAGVGPFLVKFLYLKFNLSLAIAGLAVGIAVAPGAGGGVFLGGLVVRRFKLKETLLMAAKCCLIIKVATIFTSLIWLIPGCDEVQLAGIVKPYWDSTMGGNSLISTCNKNCSCPLSLIRPVCGSDKLTYFSPCFAGCTSSDTSGVYTGCNCVSPPFNVSTPLASRGLCDRGSGCKNYIVFLVAVLLLVMAGFTLSVPNKTVVLRSVPDNIRSYAFGLQFVFQRTLGFIPGPIIYGWLFDTRCLVWAESCGRRGNCQFYDVHSLSYGIMLLAGSSHVLASLFYFISFWYCRKRTTLDEAKSARKTVEYGKKLNDQDTSV